MFDDLIKKATGGLDGIVDVLLKEAKDKIHKKIEEAFSIKRLEKLKENIYRVGKVKTILDPDSIVDLNTIYFQEAVCFGNKIYRESVSLFSEHHVLIEGGAGQGKSLYLKHLCLNEGAASNYIPVFIEFRYLSFKKGLKEELFDAIRTFGIDLDDSLFDFLAKSKKVVFILDGFDEVPNESRLETARELESIARTYPDLKIIVSSRPDSGMGSSVYFSKYKIQLLPLESQIAFVRHLYNDGCQANDIVNIIKNSGFIFEVTNTPLLLTLFTITYNARQFKPDSLSEFYSLIFPTMLYRHDRLKIGYERERKAGLTDYQMQRLFEAISFISLKDNKPQFDSSHFRYYLENASKMERIDENLEDKLIDDITNITALIVPDGFDGYTYAHKSIQEYFAAVFISKISDDKKAAFYDMTINIFDEFRKWQNVLSFLKTIDEYNYQRSYLLPLKKKLLGVGSSGKVNLKFSLVKQLIGLDSKIKIDEDGKVIQGYWGDTYSSAVYVEVSEYIQVAVLDYLANKEIELAEFLTYCPISDFETFQHDNSFVVNVVEFLKQSGMEKEITGYLSGVFESSPLKEGIVSAEKDLNKANDVVDNILDFSKR